MESFNKDYGMEWGRNGLTLRSERPENRKNAERVLRSRGYDVNAESMYYLDFAPAGQIKESEDREVSKQNMVTFYGEMMHMLKDHEEGNLDDIAPQALYCETPSTSFALMLKNRAGFQVLSKGDKHFVFHPDFEQLMKTVDENKLSWQEFMRKQGPNRRALG